MAWVKYAEVNFPPIMIYSSAEQYDNNLVKPQYQFLIPSNF